MKKFNNWYSPNWFGLILISTLLILITIISCGPNCDRTDGSDGYYHNVSMRITSINGIDTANSNMTIHKYNYVLFETLKSPKKYMELGTDNLPNKIKLDEKWFRSHDIGDTVHFDVLDTTRLFMITQNSLQRFIKTQGTK